MPDPPPLFGNHEPIVPSPINILSRRIDDLEERFQTEVRTRSVVVVDDAGTARVLISANAGAECRVALVDHRGVERVVLTGLPDLGGVHVCASPSSTDPTRVEVFAHDRVDGDGPTVGLHLVDRGNGVAGLDAFEGRPPNLWTDPS